ncbi:MAG: TrkH family potassium uptake protein, partial [Rhodobiaceae bacterium]|nr:TrkH family potassium uptake protein [Rhodobiaceae bacterium]
LSLNEITFEQSLIVAAATITNSGNIILNNLDSNLLISFDDKYKLFLSFSMILGRLEILALIGCIMSINRK